MDARLLGYFIAVYEELNFSTAARRCVVSQPSISAAIRQLEDHLGYQLFLRNPRGVARTAAGDQLYPVAIRLVRDLEGLRGLLKEPASPVLVRCGVMPGLAPDRVAGFLKEAVIAAPEIAFRVGGDDAAADIRIVSDARVADDDVFHPLWRDAYLLAAPLGHPLALKPTVALADLAGESLIVAGGAEMPATEATVTATVPGYAEVLALVAAGLGVAIVPSSEVPRPGLVARPIADHVLERNIGLACPRSYVLPAGLSLALNICRLRWQR